jgi:hypothetical protein
MASKRVRVQTGGMAYPVGYKPGLQSDFWRRALLVLIPTGFTLWAAVFALII